MSRPVRVATTIDGITYSQDTGYDQTSRVGAISYPETSPGVRLKLHYNYTASGYLSNITDAITEAVYWQATSQDAAGRILQEQLGNGLATSRSFDAVGRLKTLQTGANIQNLSYTYDLAGNLTTRQNTAQGFSESFSYDTLNRLTGVTGPAPKTYAYSLDGNITHKSDVSDIGGYVYGGTAPAGPHALTSLKKDGAVVASYVYDTNGNMLSGAGRSTTYTSYNLPKAITQGAATTSFAYSAERVRIKQTAPGETTVYINPRWDTGTHYEKTTKPITGGSVTEHQHYLYGSTGPVAVVKVIATTLSTTTTSNTRYLHHDHLGSVDAITNETGALVERLSYDAWGKRRQPNGLDAATAPIPATTHHGYTGHEHLDGLGLIHMNARVYDPNIGRFTSADPIGFEGGLNLYGYAGNNPLVNFDLSGEEYKCGTDPWCTSDRFTKSDADAYWRTGDVRPMIVSGANVDLSYLSRFPPVGQIWSVPSPLGVAFGIGDARIYGSVTVYRVDEDYVQIIPDRYDFELHNYTKPEDVLPEIGRNFMTDIGYAVTSWGGMYNNQYHGYEIIFDGLTPIPK